MSLMTSHMGRLPVLTGYSCISMEKCLFRFFIHFKVDGDWRDGLVVKSTGSSSGGPRSSPQDPL